MPEIMVCSGQNEQSYITDEFRHIKFIENFQISKQLDVGGVQPVNLA
jgi:phage-related baseplate assembly protein